MRLAGRISRIEPSITLSLDARAKGLIAAGEDVVNMTVGEPDFAPPAVVQETAVELVPLDAIRERVRQGHIDHALVVAALYRFELDEP